MKQPKTSISEILVKVAYSLVCLGATFAIAAFFVKLWWFLVLSVILADCCILFSYLAATHNKNVYQLGQALIIHAIIAHTPVGGIFGCPIFIPEYFVCHDENDKKFRMLIPAGCGLMLVATLQVLAAMYMYFLGGGFPGYPR